MEPSTLGGGLGQSTSIDSTDRLVGLRIGIFGHGTAIVGGFGCTRSGLDVVVGRAHSVNFGTLGLSARLRRRLLLVLGLLLPGGPVL